MGDFFGTIFNSSAAGLETGKLLLCMAVSLLMGVLVSLVYQKTEERYSSNFAVSLVILPPVVCAVIALVNGNLGTGIAIMGAFGLVRFRSQPGTAKEIAVVFIDMAIGLSAATGYLFFTLILTVVLMLAMIVLSLLHFGDAKESEKTLKITIPEDLDYSDVFTEIFEKYLEYARLYSVKTTNLGSMFELKYEIKLKKNTKTKELIDDLRIRNGNLPIVINRKSSEAEL